MAVRVATRADVPALQQLIEPSVRGLDASCHDTVPFYRSLGFAIAERVTVALAHPVQVSFTRMTRDIGAVPERA